MVQRYQVGWVPQTRQNLPVPKAGVLENLSSAFSSGLNERWVAQGQDAYTEWKANQSNQIIPEAEWNSSNIYWRKGIDWTPNMTLDKAKIMSQVYDDDQKYLDLQERTGFVGDALRGTTWFTTMLVADEINLIPFVGQLAKGAQLIKAGSRLSALAKADVVGRVLPKAVKTGGITEAVARASVYGAGFAGIESFALMPAAERARRNADVSALQQWGNFAMGTVLAGALGGGGFWLGKKLSNKGKDNIRKLNQDEVNGSITSNTAKTIIKTRDKINKLNAREEIVDDLDMPDIDKNDFGNANIDRNTGKKSFEINGATTNNPQAPIKATTNATTGTVTLTVTKDSLEFVIRALQNTLSEPTVNIKIAGKRAKTFTKEQLQDVDFVLNAFKVAPKLQTKATKLIVVDVDGKPIGFRNNIKTDETIAYIKNEQGKYVAQSVDDSRKLLVAAITQNPKLKAKLLDQVGKPVVQPTKTKQDIEPQGQKETYDIENNHKDKTHEEVADDLTSEGYRNIKTTDELTTLPNTIGVRNRVVKAANNGQTTVKATRYDQDGNKVVVDKDISETTAVMKEFNDEVDVLKQMESKLEDVTTCMLTSVG